MSDIVKVSDEGRARIIQLNRPEKKNALSNDLAWGVVNAVEEAAQDDSVWVIGITGSGDSFCAGLDLSGAGGEDGSPLTAMGQQLDDIGWVGRFLTVLRMGCDKPVVAGVNGVAVGAGLSLALGADIRIATRSARLIAGYPRIGGSPDGGITFSLPQLIGYEQAMRFLLENRTVDGDEAYRLGMVGEVVEDERFESRFHEYLQQLTQLSPITAQLTKRTLRRSTTAIDIEAHVRYELVNIRRAFSSEDAKEARQAFFEKRSPVFQGR